MTQTRQQHIEALLAEQDEFDIIQIINQSNLHHHHNSSPQTGESHYLIKLKVNSNYNGSAVVIHRKIYQLLEQEFKSGLHALSIEIIKS